MNLWTSIRFTALDDSLRHLADQPEQLQFTTLDGGLEAEVIRVASPHSSQPLIVKRWSKQSRPDVAAQYRLLQGLFEQGVAVSRPLGWGVDGENHPVLLTPDDGIPPAEVKLKQVRELAQLLSRVHRADVSRFLQPLPAYDFIPYFFPGIEYYDDLKERLDSLFSKVDYKQQVLIHGDYHLGNIVQKDGVYTIIDWTNGQLGDARYDVAWSTVLARIYLSDRLAAAFKAAYLADNKDCERDSELVEAIACIRWLLLNRQVGLPHGPSTKKRIRALLKSSPYLSEELL
ncbi:phosphotransferase family protein [Paenibacillus sp. GCM10023252]|uniref:phosphotransferase family protein n=1 Tax=Paenibacillus sp. GCM10023252 TaxID=3252649 RepID=UPI003613A6F5